MTTSQALKSAERVIQEAGEMTPWEAKDKAGALVAELITARIELGLDRREISRRSGMQMHVIGSGELGDSLPRVSTLIRWANVLEYDLKLVKRGCR